MGEPDDSSYLQWRAGPLSRRERMVRGILEFGGSAALAIPSLVTRNREMVGVAGVVGLALWAIGFLIALSKVHSY